MRTSLAQGRLQYSPIENAMEEQKSSRQPQARRGTGAAMSEKLEPSTKFGGGWVPEKEF
jgi:hypothetical protein